MKFDKLLIFNSPGENYVPELLLHELGLHLFHSRLEAKRFGDQKSMKFIICDSKNYFCIQGGGKLRDLFSFRFCSATLMCAQVMAKIFTTYKEGIIAQAGRERRDLEACFSLRPATFTFYQDAIFFFFPHQNDS